MTGPPQGHRFKGHHGGLHSTTQPTASVLTGQGQMAPLGLHWLQYLRLLQDSGFVPGARPPALHETAPVGTLYKEDGTAVATGRATAATAEGRVDVWRLESECAPADYVDVSARMGVRERVGRVHRPEGQGLPPVWC